MCIILFCNSCTASYPTTTHIMTNHPISITVSLGPHETQDTHLWQRWDQLSLILTTNLCHNTCVTLFSRLWLPFPLATETTTTTTTTTCLVLKRLLSTLTSKPCPTLEDQVTTELEHRNAENYSCQSMKLSLQPLASWRTILYQSHHSSVS